MRSKKLFWIAITVVFSLGLIMAACNSSDDDSNSNGGGGKDQKNPWDSVLGGTPSGNVTKDNITDLVIGLKKIAPAQKPALPTCGTLVDNDLGLNELCTVTGEVRIENCIGDPLSFDIVFDECYSATAPEVIGTDGVINIDYNALSNLLLTVTYDLDKYFATPEADITGELPIIVKLFVLLSGNTIQYTVNLDGSVTISGLDPVTGNPCTATITIDLLLREWTSDEGCGLPAGPIGW